MSLDMGTICTGWTPTLENRRHVVNFIPKDRPINLKLEIEEARPRWGGSILIARGVANYEELWALRMHPSGRLALHAGAEVKSVFVVAGGLVLSVSYGPKHGGIGCAVGSTNVVLSGSCKSSWAERTEWQTWNLEIGAGKDLADLPPYGWKISASFHLQDPVSAQAAQVRERTLFSLAGTSPGDTLKLAIQSMELWARIAKDALEQMEVKP